MLTAIKGLHHVTSLAADARQNNDFFTKVLGLRRIKKTVNFDEPSVYHLYYGDEAGTPGTVMTYFPFPHIARGRPGTGEVGTTVFSVPKGALGFWKERLAAAGVAGLSEETVFGENRLYFSGPDSDSFALAEVDGDPRVPWTHGGVDPDVEIRGFHSVSLRLRSAGATAELLQYMGYRLFETKDNVTRFFVPEGNGASVIDVEALPDVTHTREGAGSVHHVAFAVENRAAQLEVRKALIDTGYYVTPVIDRDYFWAIYFRTPGGVLFEISTNEPGFDRDEDTAHLGQSLRIPAQHAHLRSRIEEMLPPID
ncbi:VOC family protein [Pseudochelatococcus contaminans]|uniref:Glyoxalase family protein n=1 Tax=Pseudochelatococcus contaminans TaxID=1538103 RepID=A0A7W5Z4M1_9HYPH|nr:VOC family protein [Pseudochelatococcus contaminans]MBB3809627.1 glyoxalase family protein [Pseudochelatococcus contaminans]